MKAFVAGLHGAAFAGTLSVLIFFLKVICPLATGCFVDPFLVILFAPLRIFNAVGILNVISYNDQPYAILVFWIVVGFIFGLLLSPFFTKEKPSSDTETELTNRS